MLGITTVLLDDTNMEESFLLGSSTFMFLEKREIAVLAIVLWRWWSGE
jgi:hypothetical protein